MLWRSEKNIYFNFRMVEVWRKFCEPKIVKFVKAAQNGHFYEADKIGKKI
jgi:hypothetical protein